MAVQHCSKGKKYVQKLLNATNIRTERNKLTWGDIMAATDSSAASIEGLYSIQEQRETASK